MLIAIDGPDGSGKTELSNALTNRFQHLGMTVGNFSGYFLPTTYHRTLTALKQGMAELGTPMPGETEQTLYSLEWLAKLDNELPELQSNYDVVISDRYVLSRFALALLQCSTTSINLLRTALSMDRVPTPDFNVLLMAKPEVLYERISKRAFKLDIPIENKEQPASLTAIYSEFEKSQNELPWIINTFDSNTDSKNVFETVWANLVTRQIHKFKTLPTNLIEKSFELLPTTTATYFADQTQP